MDSKNNILKMYQEYISKTSVNNNKILSNIFEISEHDSGIINANSQMMMASTLPTFHTSIMQDVESLATRVIGLLNNDISDPNVISKLIISHIANYLNRAYVDGAAIMTTAINAALYETHNSNVDKYIVSSNDILKRLCDGTSVEK